MQKQDLLKRLFTAGYLEGISYILLLCIGMPLKYMAGEPAFVRILGSMHGALFIWYIVLLFKANKAYNWPSKKLFLCGAASLIPFGTFFLHKFIDDSK